MPRVLWPLVSGRPCIEVTLTLAVGGQPIPLALLADSGAGSRNDPFGLILDEDDCLLCGGVAGEAVSLGAAYLGSFPVYLMSVQIPPIGFNGRVRAVGVGSVPANFNGIACFAFLNQFTYGNFGDSNQFGLER